MCLEKKTHQHVYRSWRGKVEELIGIFSEQRVGTYLALLLCVLFVVVAADCISSTVGVILVAVVVCFFFAL
jgi:hypothetical protein